MKRTHPLVAAWRECPLEHPPFLLPGDEALTSERLAVVHESFESFIGGSGFDIRRDRRLHLGLIPIPYVGSLETAKVFVLLLNPGLHAGDYFAEERVPAYRAALIRNLRQEASGDAYPFFGLNPSFSWHPGFSYWDGRLHTVTRALSRRDKVSRQTALMTLAQKVAALELYPYHSSSFGLPHRVGRELTSRRLMLDFVHEVLAPKAS